MLISCELKNFECSRVVLNIVYNMYVIISDDNVNGIFTGTDLNYIHHGLILTLNVQTVLANIYQLMMQVIPPIEQT